MNDRGIIASSLLSPMSEISIPEITTHFKLLKDSSSNSANDLLIHLTIPVTLYNNLLTFHDTSKEFELQGDRLKMITNKDYNVNFANLSDKEIMYNFAKEMCFDAKSPGNKSSRDGLPIRLLKSPALLISGSGVSSSHKTRLLPSDPNELCNRLKLLL